MTMQIHPPARLVLQANREKSLRNRHPWVFSGAVARVDGAVSAGGTVEIVAADGSWLARGAWSPRSQIRARVWTFDPDETIDAAFFHRRLAQAIDHRRAILEGTATDACRLVNGESDGLPGLIVDRYRGWLVGQFLFAGVERWKGAIVDSLTDLFPSLAGIYERSDADVRRKEGLASASGCLTGRMPPDHIDLVENGCRYRVDIKTGHKTGFYLDQRDNRAMFAAYAHGTVVLNCFAYTGGFGVAALMAGARHVTHVDTAATALELARVNTAINPIDSAQADYVVGDVFETLRRYQAAGRRFDRIVLDPPKFVASKSDLPRAGRGYKDINRLAFTLMSPGGLLFTFSCSGLMPPDLFQKIVADAALDANRHAVVLHRLGQPSDHPTALPFPEGSYLKGLVCRVGSVLRGQVNGRKENSR